MYNSAAAGTRNKPKQVLLKTRCSYYLQREIYKHLQLVVSALSLRKADVQKPSLPSISRKFQN